MVLHRVWCVFEPEYQNPLTGRGGRWRVKSKEIYESGRDVISSRMSKEIAILSLRSPKPGSIISPRHAVKEVLEARRTTA